MYLEGEGVNPLPFGITGRKPACLFCRRFRVLREPAKKRV
ncbi:hypothetical protein DET0176 [Dehalococcoides mccartyi 195]|uniref:Uncharacterized protein n=1 Tax=Dehalococcoides mccartyi (strain ATCC BAA-2266 / KCTC 15142 / 195) TaxID=243164 RepID=Q3ZA25_DEHM1|nr:hypothetical protein DET0176 [Dehalococcoides mccartyi 195]